MQPSITAMSSVLLLACLIGAASDTGAGSSNQPAVLQDTPLTEVTGRQVFDMTLFQWMYDSLDNASQLMICADVLLLLPGEELKNNPTLVYQMVKGSQTIIEGKLDANQSCSLFTQEGRVRLAKTDTLYQLNLIVTNKENATIYRSGSVTFGMPVDTSTISCHKKPYTRATGLDPAINLDPPCISDSLTLRNDVCYLEGEFSSTNLCYTINEKDLRICLQGSSLATAEEVDGLSISYLAYKDVASPVTPAHLYLEFDDNDEARPMEALIWKQDRTFATKCTGAICPIPHFEPGFAQYDVCAVTLADGAGGLPVNTSTSSITDLNAGAVMYNGSPLLQFDYVNANEKRYYIAYVVDIPEKNVTVDCSGVPSTSTCRGYFKETCTTVAVEYADAAMGPMGNKIMFPCKPINGGRS